MTTFEEHTYRINETLFPSGRVKLYDKTTGRNYIYDDVLAVYKVSYLNGSGYQLYTLDDVRAHTPDEDLTIYNSDDYELYFEGWVRI